MILPASNMHPVPCRRGRSAGKAASGGLRSTHGTRPRRTPCVSRGSASFGTKPRWGAAKSQTVEAVGGATATPGGATVVAAQNMTVPGTMFATEDAAGKAGIRHLADMRDNYGANVSGQEYVMATYSATTNGVTQYGFTAATTDSAGKSASVPVNLVPSGATWLGTIHNHPDSTAMKVRSDIPSPGDLRTTFTPGASGPRGSGYVWDATRGGAFKFTVRPGVDPYAITTREAPRSAYIREGISW